MTHLERPPPYSGRVLLGQVGGVWVTLPNHLSHDLDTQATPGRRPFGRVIKKHRVPGRQAE